MVTRKVLNFYEILDYYMWYERPRSNTSPECGSTDVDKQQKKCMHTDYYFSFEMLLPIFFYFFWIRIVGMERLKEYADEESPFNEQSDSKREPIKEVITNDSSKLLQIVKELRTEMETVKKENERILRA